MSTSASPEIGLVVLPLSLFRSKMFSVSASKPLSRVIFDKYDADGSGSISRSELRSVCYGLGHVLTEEEEALALHRLDINGDGHISYPEFAAWWREKDRFAKFNLTDSQQSALLQCVQYFKYFDKDASGHLSREEFVHLHADLVRNGYGPHLSGEAADDLAKLDKGGDGSVALDEYVDWLVGIGALAKN